MTTGTGARGAYSLKSTTTYALAALALVATAAGCSRHGKAAPVGGSDVPPSQVKLKRNVELTQAERKPLDYYVETVGYLEAEATTDLAAGVTGIVDEVLFREGQWVDANSVILKVDQRRYTAAFEQAVANEKRAEANLALARELAQNAAMATVGTSREEKAKTRLGVSIAEAELTAAHAARVLAEHNLHRSRVHAPYAGQINKRLVAPGMYLKEETVIGTIADLSRMRLVGWVPEKAAPTVLELMAKQKKARAPRLAGACLAGPSPWPAITGVVLDDRNFTPGGFDLEFTLLPFPNQTFRGRIFYMSTLASPDTHMFECKAEVNARELDAHLEPGMTAQIRVPLRGNPNACVVPEESVRVSEKGWIAFVPEARPGKDGQTEWFARAREVKPGFRSPGWVEILQGIKPGESLVRKGADALEDNTPIQFPAEQKPR
jgi:multidrug efflux system membrane fusion protein